MDKKSLLKKANELPLKPGVYMMKDKDGNVIYVGKAKVLKNRVTGYFRNGEHTPKTEKMVSRVCDFDVIITASELDALLTECSLIKRYNPVYNIALKHGRGYQFVYLSEKNGFPVLRLETFRTAKGQYWGPFLSRQKALVLVDLVSKAFCLPRCSQKSNRKKVCLEYHLGKCPGYCEGRVGKAEMDELLMRIGDVFDGNIDAIRADLCEKMQKASDELLFERAAELRDRIRALDYVAEKQKAPAPPHRNADYIAYAEQQEQTAIFTLRVRNGYIVGEHCDFYEETFSDGLLREYVERFYTENEAPGRVYMTETYEWTPLVNEWLHDRVCVPSFKQDAGMLDICRRNASERLLQRLGRTERAQRSLALFCEFTGLQSASRMELYDVSHLAGSDVVCGMIACTEGVLDRERYRRFKVGRYDGRDDTAYMSEAVTRRLQRFADGDEHFSPLPDVIVCDGALAQIHAVSDVVASFGYPICVIGFKKDSRHRTKSVVFADGRELALLRSPEVLSFCGRLQESVHKYAISYHRALRDNSAQRSELMQVPGVGKARVKKLFDRFRTLEAIRTASVEELTSVPGISEAMALSLHNVLNGGEST